MRSCYVLCLFLLSQAVAEAVDLDATREEVLAELGKPKSIAQRGGREIFLYSNGVRLELQDGRIVSAAGLTLGEKSAGAQQPMAPPKVSEKAPAPLEDELSATDAESAERENSNVIGQSQVELEKTFDALVAARDQPSATPARRPFDYLEIAAELFLILLMTAAALKLACKYWGAEVFWSRILAVSAVDSVIRGSLRLAGEMLFELPTLFYLDELIAAVVMGVLLKRLSVNQSTAQAVELTITTKTFTVIVGAFLVSAVLNSLH